MKSWHDEQSTEVREIPTESGKTLEVTMSETWTVDNDDVSISVDQTDRILPDEEPEIDPEAHLNSNPSKD